MKKDEEIKAMEHQAVYQDSKIQNFIEKIQQFERRQEEADRNADKLNELFQQNIIDEHGNLGEERDLI